MAHEQMQELWYAFWLIKAIGALFFLLAAALLCRWIVRRIRAKNAKRRRVMHSIVHPLGTLKAPQNLTAPVSTVVDESRRENKKRAG